MRTDPTRAAARLAALLLAAATARRVRVGRQIAPAFYAATAVYLIAARAIRPR